MVQRDETRPEPTRRGLKASSGDEFPNHTISPSTNQFDDLHDRAPVHRRARRAETISASSLEGHEVGHTVFAPGRAFDVIAERDDGR
jgi:hypothetical protein